MYFINAANADLSAQKMLNILREVDREDLQILDVETLMKLFEKQIELRGGNASYQSNLQIIWRKLYETYFIKNDVHRNDKLLAFNQRATVKLTRNAASDSVRLRSQAD